MLLRVNCRLQGPFRGLCGHPKYFARVGPTPSAHELSCGLGPKNGKKIRERPQPLKGLEPPLLIRNGTSDAIQAVGPVCRQAYCIFLTS